MNSAPPADFRTSQLSLAAVLNMNGFKHVRLEALDSNVQWVFAENDGMKALVAKFEAGKVKVEPRAFQLQVKKVRDEMYQFSRRSRRSA